MTPLVCALVFLVREVGVRTPKSENSRRTWLFSGWPRERNTQKLVQHKLSGPHFVHSRGFWARFLQPFPKSVVAVKYYSNKKWPLIAVNGCPQKRSKCASFPGKGRKKGTHINFFRGRFWGTKRGPKWAIVDHKKFSSLLVSCPFRSGPGKPNQRKVGSWTFRRGIPEQKFDMWIVIVFLREKHQNSQKWAKFMNFSFWPLLWFGLPGRLLSENGTICPLGVFPLFY